MLLRTASVPFDADKNCCRYAASAATAAAAAAAAAAASAATAAAAAVVVLRDKNKAKPLVFSTVRACVRVCFSFFAWSLF